MILRKTLQSVLAQALPQEGIVDYCPNGLQVQGKENIQRVVTGVTASRALIEAAAQAQADALIVHHGIYWKGDDPCCVGMLHGRLKPLIDHEINLFGFHLPLDVHPLLGNNAQLANLMDWSVEETLTAGGVPNLLWVGSLKAGEHSAEQLCASLHQRLGRRPLVLGQEYGDSIHRIAWCTGAAHRFLPQAKAAGAQAFVTGEVSEATCHIARELKITCFAAGHHATERYGVQALGAMLASDHGLDVTYIEIDNPV